MMRVEELKNCIEKKGIAYRHIVLGERVKTAREAAMALGVSLKRIIKTIILVDNKNQYYAAIVPGDKMVDLDKVKMIIGSDLVRLASSDEIKRTTGYEVGALPPLCIDNIAGFIIDSEVLTHETVYGGGGTIDSLIEISPRDLIIANRAIIRDIAKR
ncbi:MAG: YbaK/EbsC family protein [Sulfolobales archaeon]